LSSKNQVELDCSEEQWAMRALVWYSGNMGLGDVVETLDFPDNMFKPVAPSSIMDMQLKIVCGSVNQSK
jgi:hypothetical protein